jgi:two-component system sensor histidine kinase KdpD
LKTVILNTVSHDLRTPIATIRAAVGGLEDDELDLSAEDRAGLLETIRLETARLSRLVENVLDLSRLEAGAASPRRELWAADDLLARAAAEVSVPLRIAVAPSADLPAVHVDAVQLQRALVNLLENALKFSEGTVELTATAADDEVVVEVLDRGRGLNAPGGTSAGLGLGLSIARGFVTANGGVLTLDARNGGGTRACVRLPGRRVPAELQR